MTSGNGHTPTLDELKEQYRSLRARARVGQAKAEAELWESAATGMGYWAGWSDLLDPFASRRDDFSSAWMPWAQGTLYGRQEGRNRPFQWTDFDLDRMRSLARWLATKNDIAIGILDCLADYTVGTGYGYEARPGKRHLKDQAALELAHQVQEVVDEFLSLNTLGEMPEGDAQDEPFTWADRERDCVIRAVRDGEVFVRGFPQDDGTLLVRFIEPEQIRERVPDPFTAFGIETAPGDVERPICYWTTYDQTDYEQVPAAEVAHLKRNVDSCVKRGLSDLFSSGESIDGVWKLLRNMREAGAVQAAIAWIEQFESTQASQVSGSIAAIKDLNRPNLQDPLSGRDLNFQRYQPGTIVKVGKGKEYIPAPLAANTTQHTSIVQACLRSVGSRWRMPEYMISGDSSNSAYASTLVSGAPFVKRVECQQAVFGRFFLRVIWMALRHAAKHGRFKVQGREYDWQTLSKLIDVVPTPPLVAIANSREQAEIDHQDMSLGVMSKQTRAARRGLDWEQEKKLLSEDPLTRVPGRQTDLDQQGNPVGANAYKATSGLQPVGAGEGEPPAPAGAAAGEQALNLGEEVARDLTEPSLEDLLEAAAAHAGEMKWQTGNTYWSREGGKTHRISKADYEGGGGGGGGKQPAAQPEPAASAPPAAAPAAKGKAKAVKKEPAAKAEKPQKADPAAIKDLVAQMRKDSKVTPDDAKALAKMLLGLTVAQTAQLKKDLGLKASGDKETVATKLAERALAQVAAGPAAEPAPAPAKKAPAAKKPAGKKAAADAAGDARIQDVVKRVNDLTTLAAGVDQETGRQHATRQDLEKALAALDLGSMSLKDLKTAGKALSVDVVGATRRRPNETMTPEQRMAIAIERQVLVPFETLAGDEMLGMKRARAARKEREAGKPKEEPATAPKEATPAPADHAAKLASAWDSLPGQGGTSGPDKVVHLADVPADLGLGKEQIHQAVQHLQKQGALSLSGPDRKPTDRDRAAGFKGEDGNLKTTATVRDEDKLKALAGGKQAEPVPAPAAKEEPAAPAPAPAPAPATPAEEAALFRTILFDKRLHAGGVPYAAAAKAAGLSPERTAHVVAGLKAHGSLAGADGKITLGDAEKFEDRRKQANQGASAAKNQGFIAQVAQDTGPAQSPEHQAAQKAENDRQRKEGEQAREHAHYEKARPALEQMLGGKDALDALEASIELGGPRITPQALLTAAEAGHHRAMGQAGVEGTGQQAYGKLLERALKAAPIPTQHEVALAMLGKQAKDVGLPVQTWIRDHYGYDWSDGPQERAKTRTALEALKLPNGKFSKQSFGGPAPKRGQGPSVDQLAGSFSKQGQLKQFDRAALRDHIGRLGDRDAWELAGKVGLTGGQGESSLRQQLSGDDNTIQQALYSHYDQEADRQRFAHLPPEEQP